MVALITDGIKVQVETKFRHEYSNPGIAQFIFTYYITITNQTENTVQLLRRHWIIKDLATGLREVEGEGVVGQQPILAAGETYTYESGCNLSGEIGSMQGTYLFLNILHQKRFSVNIPEFNLVVPHLLN